MSVSLKKQLFSWVPVVFWAACIFYVSSFPTAKASGIHWEDFFVKKLAHLIEYAVFAVLSFRALVRSGIDRRRSAKYAVLAVFIYGATDETHQGFVPGREPHLRDVLIDTIGGTIGIIAMWNILPRAPKRLRDLAKKLDLV